MSRADSAVLANVERGSVTNDASVCGGPAVKFTFMLKGQLKSGKNRILITRAGHRYPPKSFKVWRDEMLRQIMGAAIHAPMVKPVSMIVDYTPGDNIRRDVPGMLDALCHLIEKAGMVLDDAQIKYVIWHTHPVVSKGARCGVTLEERL